MSDGTHIEYVDSTLVLTTGCRHVSSGCDNCFAATLTSGRLRHLPEYEGLAVAGKFTGQVRVHPERLLVPLGWRKPRRCFICDMGDLFHPGVPAKFIERVFAMAALRPRHTFLILTKQPDRMRHLLNSPGFATAVLDAVPQLAADAGRPRLAAGVYDGWDWPLANVHVGVSAEDQKTAGIRIPKLLDTLAAVWWVSAEPLLGPVSLAQWLRPAGPRPALSWVVTGGESGARARPPHPDWFRMLRDQATSAGVPFFFKQWGSWAPWTPGPRGAERHMDAPAMRRAMWVYPDGQAVPWVQLVPAGRGVEVRALMEKIGKVKAGNVLDGTVWNGLPVSGEGPPESAPMAAG